MTTTQKTMKASFCFRVECPTREAANTLEDSMASAMEAGLEDAPELGLNLDYVEAERHQHTVCISSKEGTDLNFLADVLQDYLRHNDPDGSIEFNAMIKLVGVAS